MNQKLAKYLRHITEYRNSSATPPVKDFPGVAKNLVRVPVYETRKVTRKEWSPREKKYIEVTKTKMVHGKNGKPRLLPPERKLVDGKLTIIPREDLVACTNPVKVNLECARGRYRMLKKATKKFGLQHVVDVLHQAGQDQLSLPVEDSNA